MIVVETQIPDIPVEMVAGWLFPLQVIAVYQQHLF
jgi:hypothetical protein